MLANHFGADLEALRDMALFVAVAEEGSFTIAAKNLGLPKSTLAWRINEFEISVGVKLFNRTTRRVLLTSDGLAQFERCKAAVAEAQAITQDMRERSSAPRGRLRVSTTIDFATLLLAPVLPEFTRRYPEIAIDFDTTADRVDLFTENMDLAIRMGPLPDSGLVVRRLMNAHINLYASPAYLREFGTPAVPEDLHRHQCLKAGAATGEVTWALKRKGKLTEITVMPRFWGNHLGLVRQLVMNGLGIGALVEELYADDIKKGRVVRVLSDWSLSTVAVSTVAPHRQLPAKARVFLDFLVEKFALNGHGK